MFFGVNFNIYFKEDNQFQDMGSDEQCPRSPEEPLLGHQKPKIKTLVFFHTNTIVKRK